MGCLAICALGLLVAGCGGGPSPESGRPTRPEAAPAIPAPKEAVSGVGPIEPMVVVASAPQAPRSTPKEAVRAYLTAERDGDFAASYAVLSEHDRNSIGGVVQWQERHAQLPTYVAFEFWKAAPDGTGESSMVTTLVDAEPRLDESAGFVPSEATINWPTVREGGGWTVTASKAEVSPLLPSEHAAAAVALRWADAVRSGSSPDDFQYDGTFLGQPDVADRLARLDPDRPFSAGTPGRLEDWDHAATVTNAFGPQAVEWARVVRVDGPAPVDVVTAPLGDHWIVVGAVAA
ncbi:MAG: hypothetical protein ACHQDC_02915 [Acidimicrobiales bacterium]